MTASSSQRPAMSSTKAEPLFAMRGERNLPKLDTINEKNFDTRKLDRNDRLSSVNDNWNSCKNGGEAHRKGRALSIPNQPHHLW